MDCITFTANGDEAELRQRLMAPALNTDQALYVSAPVKTGRIMAKDEDVCLHCGLCAERCPTGVGMQKFLLDMAQADDRAHAGPRCRSRPTSAWRRTEACDGYPRESLTRVNDFVVKFANVNGSGSASANGLFARAILRMGVPVAARNIFPSNIQGLPTWYEVRIVEAGWRGRRGGVDLMVAMNPQTWDKDVAEIETGGYLFYDSTKPLPPSKFRDDVTALGVPLTAICNETYSDVRQRQLFKNIVYLGALSALLDLDPAEIERLFAEQYRGKEALLESNRKALQLGRDYALANFECPIGLSVARRDAVGDQFSSTATLLRPSVRSTAARPSPRGIRSRRRRLRRLREVVPQAAGGT